MNIELVNKLIEKATTIIEPNDPDYRQESFDKVLFAELIVRECISGFKDRIQRRNMSNSEFDQNVCYGMECFYYDITDKFEIEE